MMLPVNILLKSAGAVDSVDNKPIILCYDPSLAPR